MTIFGGQILEEPIRRGRVRTLLCEGYCSGAYAEARNGWIRRMKTSGFTPEQVRAQLSATMCYTGHREVKGVVDVGAGTRTVWSACEQCGHERVSGCEEYDGETTYP